MSFVKPVTVQVKAVAGVGVQDLVASSTAVIVYPVMAEPPSSVAATQVTVAEASPATAVGAAGLPGSVTVAGVAALDGSEATEGPTTLLATKVKVYGVPLVKPVTVQVSAVAGEGVHVLVGSSTVVTV